VKIKNFEVSELTKLRRGGVSITQMRPKEPSSQGNRRGPRPLSVEFLPREGKRHKLRRKSTTTIGSALGGKI
jgi:hypothetical protein